MGGYVSVGDFCLFVLRFLVENRPCSIRMSYSGLSKQRSESCGSALSVGANGGCWASASFFRLVSRRLCCANLLLLHGSCALGRGLSSLCCWLLPTSRDGWYGQPSRSGRCVPLLQ